MLAGKAVCQIVEIAPSATKSGAGSHFACKARRAGQIVDEKLPHFPKPLLVQRGGDTPPVVRPKLSPHLEARV